MMIFFFSVEHSSLCIFPSSVLPPHFQGTDFGMRVVGLMSVILDPELCRSQIAIGAAAVFNLHFSC